ncbi:lipoprotein signal peptidase [Neisseria sp. 74A18]|uniref:lipoprotein signal peptidase n=1 Tax=Neisseria sp. 74A18 TaxID=1696094 RepID=UPI001E38497A|nr:lipoprotein signal peptidase [Neisseria sp. 74A18]
MRPLQNPHLRRISALCAAHSFAYLYDMSALAVLLRLELHPHLGVLQRSRPYAKVSGCSNESNLFRFGV